MKKCPLCAEEIQDEAIKCRFCGEFIEQKPTEKPVTKKRNLKPFIILSIAVIAAAGIFFYQRYQNEKEAKLQQQNQLQLEQEVAEQRQKEIDRNALTSINISQKKYTDCWGDAESLPYSDVYDCLLEVGSVYDSYEKTSCPKEFKEISDGYKEAKTECKQAAFYSEGDYIKPGISTQEYSEQVALCDQAVDQFNQTLISCGGVIADFSIVFPKE